MLIAANWKAYVGDRARAQKLLALSKRLAASTNHEIVLAPPAPFVGMLAAKNRSKVAFAAQNLSLATGGAHTGESTAQAFASAGATYAIVGHSERRAAGETNADVAAKLQHAFAHGLTPILCVGERERDGEGKYLSFIREEIHEALAPLTPKERKAVIIAYEPIWAIGKTAAQAIGPAELAELVLYIRKVLAELLPGNVSARARILYGGSAEPDNVRSLAAASGIDGFLVGHASADPASFAELLRRLT